MGGGQQELNEPGYASGGWTTSAWWTGPLARSSGAGLLSIDGSPPDACA